MPGAVTLIAVLLAAARPATAADLHLERVRLPPGFEISVFTARTPGARSLALGDRGTVFVGSRDEGRVYAVRDGRVVTIASDLEMPNGVAFRDGALYVAEVSRILRFDDIESRLDDPPRPVTLGRTFPRERSHGWKFIRFGPDGSLYVPVGAPCNVCDRDADGYAAIYRLSADGKDAAIFARGVRNTVGFDWQPGTGVLWFTDNGRDLLGDDVPPDELDRAPRAGLHFGYPYCHAGRILDPEFGRGHSCAEYTAPAMELGPHVAALGMRFYTGSMFPPEYRGQIFIAEHGSWNRSRKTGYRVMLVSVFGDRAVSYVPFAEGWLEGEHAWGRPVDVMVMPDGALLVSDDEAGAIYRIAWRGGESRGAGDGGRGAR